MTFAQLNLDTRISKAILNCGYTKTTPVQSHCIPNILEGKDLVASAPTGTGKTAAFILPALQRLCEKNLTKKPRILILTPTRELATQITQAAGKYGKFLQFNMTNLVGGMPYRQQIKDLSRAVDLIVATPGRLLDHLENNRVDLSGIQMLIFDEADRMLDMGFVNDVQYIAKQTPTHRQTLLFSATIDDKLAHIIPRLLKSPTRINLSPEKMSPLQISQRVYFADNVQHKMRLLDALLKSENMFKGIIFTATKINADKLAYQLEHMGYNAAPIHGDLTQNKRNKTIEQLRRGKIQFLVATDVAARGLDISDVTHVINYDLPKFCEDYIHRIGRTGRAEKSGIAISFVLPTDMRHLQQIERFTQQKISQETISGLEPTYKKPSGVKFGKKKPANSNSAHFAKKRWGGNKKGPSAGANVRGQAKNQARNQARGQARSQARSQA